VTGWQILIAAAFGAVAVLGVAVELLARRPGSTVPTLSDLCAHAMSYDVGRVPVGRLVLLGFWWWIGWHFFAR
jgi:hypothetical protein